MSGSTQTTFAGISETPASFFPFPTSRRRGSQRSCVGKGLSGLASRPGRFLSRGCQHPGRFWSDSEPTRGTSVFEDHVFVRAVPGEGPILLNSEGRTKKLSRQPRPLNFALSFYGEFESHQVMPRGFTSFCVVGSLLTAIRAVWCWGLKRASWMEGSALPSTLPLPQFCLHKIDLLVFNLTPAGICS